MSKIKITVFTPTYNRAYILENVYRSLLKQEYTGFEWLVVNDGSTDNTDELMDRLMAENPPFEIVYKKKENGGKYTTINMAIDCARGEYLMVVDSDDFLSDDALERVDYWTESINDIRDEFCGVSGLKCYTSSGIIGGEWKNKSAFVDISSFDRDKYGLGGDKAEVFRIAVLKKYYPIPVFEGEHYVEEGVLWNRMANAGYKIRYFNEAIYFCEYLEDGLTANRYKNWLNNFKGYTVWMKEMVHANVSLTQKFKSLCMFILLAEKKGMDVGEISKAMEVSKFSVVLSKIVVAVYHKGIAKKTYALPEKI